MKSNWWKWLCAGLLFYTLIAGLLLPVPRMPILHETIRNLYFHVPMWFGMMAMLSVSLFYSIRFLAKENPEDDIRANEAVTISMLLGLLGLLTGMMWANYTWGSPWPNDPKLNGVAIGMLAYLAYMILRGSLTDESKRARISSVYNIFAYVMFMLFIMVLPRLSDSLHPGNGGNPAFGQYDMDNTMRLVFYPAVIGWIMLAVWMWQLRVRTRRLTEYVLEKNSAS